MIIRYHLVDNSPWPFIVSGGVLQFFTTFVCFMNGYLTVGYVGISLLVVFSSVSYWLRDVIREGSLEGQHTSTVSWGLRLGFALFIVSEIMFFFGFFWGYFWLCQSTEDSLSGLWPSAGVATIDPYGLPLLNTIILLSSGTTLTYAHEALLLGNRRGLLLGMLSTLLLALLFLCVQLYEYIEGAVMISDGAFGSCFYLLTGFHGFHVLVGFIMLVVTSIRIFNYDQRSDHHVGFEVSAWYWHFVDVVWLFLFVIVYIVSS